MSLFLVFAMSFVGSASPVDLNQPVTIEVEQVPAIPPTGLVVEVISGSKGEYMVIHNGVLMFARGEKWASVGEVIEIYL